MFLFSHHRSADGLEEQGRLSLGLVFRITEALCVFHSGISGYLEHTFLTGWQKLRGAGRNTSCLLRSGGQTSHSASSSAHIPLAKASHKTNFSLGRVRKHTLSSWDQKGRGRRNWGWPHLVDTWLSSWARVLPRCSALLPGPCWLSPWPSAPLRSTPTFLWVIYKSLLLELVVLQGGGL
jgi:hypothetical protein